MNRTPATTLEPTASAARLPLEPWLIPEARLAPLAAWFDRELPTLEDQFRRFQTRDSLAASLGR